MPAEIDYLGEGVSDDAVARRLIEYCGGTPATSYRKPGRGPGKDSLDKRLNGLNAGSRFGRPVLVLRDLDADCGCPGQLVTELLPIRAPKMLLRICVRSTESWFMADRDNYAAYCGVPKTWIPDDPEAVLRLKDNILGWCVTSRGSRLQRHVAATRRRGVPDWASLGEWHFEFALRRWDVDTALARAVSSSLNRAVQRIAEMVDG